MPTIIIPGTLVPKGRPRFSRKTGHVYTPKRTQSSEALIRDFARKEFPKPLDGPVSVRIICYYPRPKNMIWKRKPMPREWKCTRPDIDNIIKTATDALQGIAYRDDGQICRIEAEKWICAGDESPMVSVTVERY